MLGFFHHENYIFSKVIDMEGTGISIKFKEDAMVFIDGNNFYHNLKSMKINPSYLDFSKLSEFVCRHFGYNHKKTFYYNSIPKLEDGKIRYWKTMKFFEQMEKLPKFEVKKRKLQRTSTQEQRKEKGLYSGFCSFTALSAKPLMSTSAAS